MSKELEKSIKHVFDRAKEMGDWYEDESPHITKKLNEDIEIVKKALDEFECVKHNYNALKEMYDNSVAYATKIQNELNELKKRNAPMKPNYGGKFPECPVCRKLLHSIWQKHCDSCTQAIDWSDGNE